METLDSSVLFPIARIFGDNFTKTELTRIIEVVDMEEARNGFPGDVGPYNTSCSRKDYLSDYFQKRCDVHKGKDGVYNFLKTFLEIALSPTNFANDENRENYKTLLKDTNKILILKGLEILEGEKLVPAKPAEMLKKVYERVNRLSDELEKRNIHSQIYKFCQKDIINEDYVSIVFESTKSLAERIRELTGSKLDGSRLFQEAFSTKNPMLLHNPLETESERNQFMGLRELLEAIFHLFRNPAAHTPKINLKIEKENLLDILTVISFAHKHLDAYESKINVKNQE